jgi:hypothetical protein
VRLGKALPGTGLPTGIIGHGTDEGYLIVPRAIQQHRRGGIPFVDEVLGGEPVALGQRGVDDLYHVGYF